MQTASLLKSISNQGVDLQVLSLVVPGPQGETDAKKAAALAREANDWLYNEIKDVSHFCEKPLPHFSDRLGRFFFFFSIANDLPRLQRYRCTIRKKLVKNCNAA